MSVCLVLRGLNKKKHSHKPREITANIQPPPMTLYSLQKRSLSPSFPSSPCEFVVKSPGSAKSSGVQTLSSHYKVLELGIDRHRGSTLAFDLSKALFLKVALLLWPGRKCRGEDKKKKKRGLVSVFYIGSIVVVQRMALKVG